MQPPPPQGMQPYPRPYYGPHPQYPQRRGWLGFFIVILVIIIIFAAVSCTVMVYMGNFAYNNYQGKGQQNFNGTVNYIAMIKALNNASFSPTAGGSNPILFIPFCGAVGSKDANETRLMMQHNRNTITYSNTSALVRYATKPYATASYDTNHITTKLKCVMKRVKEIFVNELGLNLTSETSSKAPMPTPGFEGIAVVVAVTVIVAVRWVRKRKHA